MSQTQHILRGLSTRGPHYLVCMAKARSHFGDVLASARERRFLTQSGLATAAGVSLATIQNYERDPGFAGQPKMLAKVIRALDQARPALSQQEFDDLTAPLGAAAARFVGEFTAPRGCVANPSIRPELLVALAMAVQAQGSALVERMLCSLLEPSLAPDLTLDGASEMLRPAPTSRKRRGTALPRISA